MPAEVGILDLIIIGTMLLFTVRGLARGLVPELGGVLSIVFAVIAAGNDALHGLVSGFMEGFLPDPGWADFIGYIIIFLVVYIILRMVFQILERVVYENAPGWLDRSLGAVAGSLKGMVACTLILLCLAYVAPKSDFRRASMLAPYFNEFWAGVNKMSGGIHRFPELSIPKL